MKQTALLLLFALHGCGPSPVPAPIYLGHVATSGPARGTGEQEVLGIRLATMELARSGQDRVGERPVYVKHADARGEGAMEAQAVRLVTLSRVVGLFGGNTAEEVTLLDRSRVPLLTPLGATPRGVSELVFATGISPSAQGEALARFAVLEAAVTRMVLLVDERREEARTLADAFEREFQKALQEKKVAFTKPVRVTFGDDAKFAELAKRIGELRPSDAKAQGVLFAGSAQDYEEWRQALPSPEFQIFFGGEEGTLRESNPRPAYVVSSFAAHKDLPKTMEFAQKFRETFKEEPDAHAALAYDAIRILADVLRRAQTPVNERIVEELRNTKDFPGLTGPLSFGADQQLRRPIFAGRMTGPVFVPVKRYDPPGS
jgi:branched-chain amino acid transport system substrate-binding protein